MRTSLLSILFVTLLTATFAQPPSKQQLAADKQRMAEAMKKLNETTSKMDPKAKRAYDSTLNLYGIGAKMDNAISQVNSNSTATPPKTAAFALLPAAKAKAGEIYTALKQNNASVAKIGNAAVALWIQGRSQIALSLMTQTCKDNPDNTDNLGNYAAMLTMMGTPDQAIPILNDLDKKFRNNSTILNNLGQAYYAKGDTAKAAKYLQNALAVCPTHPQASKTLSIIHNNNNNTKTPPTTQSANRNSFPPDNKSDDLLNLGPFAPMEFPRSYQAQLGYEKQYKQFRADIDQQIKPLKKLSDESNKATVAQLEKQQKAFMAARSKALADPGSITQGQAMQIAGAPLFAEKMNARENIVLQNLQRKKNAIIQKMAEFKKGEGAAIRNTYDAAMSAIRKKWAGVGEGGSNNGDNLCAESVKAVDAYLNAYNTKLEEFYLEYLQVQKQYLNELSYLSLYTSYPELQPGVNAGLKIQWLNDLAYKAEVLQVSYGCTSAGGVKGGRLSEFKDPHCNINSEFGQSLGLANLGFSIKITCSGMTTAFNALIIGVTLNQDLDHAGFGDSFKNCTVTIAPKAGVSGKLGPVEAGASVSAGVDINIDRTGITDVSAVGGVEVEAGIGGHGVSINSGVLK